jgi:hypothetical protein
MIAFVRALGFETKDDAGDPAQVAATLTLSA